MLSKATMTTTLLVFLLLLIAPSSVSSDEAAAATDEGEGGDDAPPAMSAQEAAASMAEKAGQLINPELLQSNGGKKTFSQDDEELAEMNLQLQQVFMDKINELPEDQRAGFIGKMHSPEMQEKIKKEFTSEKFQDHIDKLEAEQGVERPGNPYNERARQVKAEKAGQPYVPKKKKKKKKKKKGGKTKGGGDAEGGGGSGEL